MKRQMGGAVQGALRKALLSVSFRRKCQWHKNAGHFCGISGKKSPRGWFCLTLRPEGAAKTYARMFVKKPVITMIMSHSSALRQKRCLAWRRYGYSGPRLYGPPICPAITFRYRKRNGQMVPPKISSSLRSRRFAPAVWRRLRDDATGTQSVSAGMTPWGEAIGNRIIIRRNI